MRPQPAAAGALGAAAPHFLLPDTDGQIYALGECVGPAGVVVAFLGHLRPEVAAVAPRLAATADALRDLGYGVVAISPGEGEAHPRDAPGPMGAFARGHGWPFPYLHDASQKVARAYGALRTPEFFGYGRDLRLAYRGRLDDGGADGAAPSRAELVEAMRRLAETGAAPARQHPAQGAAIAWRAP